MKRVVFWTVTVASLILTIVAFRSGSPSYRYRQTIRATPSLKLASVPIHTPTSQLPGHPTPSASVRPPDARPPAQAMGESTPFATWAEDFLARRPASGVSRGVALAWQRRELLRELIRTNPEQALTQSIPFHWRSTLPPEVTRYFETQIDGTGDLTVAIAEQERESASTVYRYASVGGHRYQAFVYGRRLYQTCQSHIPLHGIEIDGQMAVASDPIRIVTTEEADALLQARDQSVRPVCILCGQPLLAPQSLPAELGGELGYFCGVDHLQLVQRRWLKSESSLKKSSGTDDLRTHGPKSLLYMRLNFPDDLTEPISEPNAYAVMARVNDFYTESSYNLTSLETTVTPLLTLPQPKSWYGTNNFGTLALLEDARAMAKNAGYDTANHDLDIACFTGVPTYDWAGLGYVGGKGTWLQSSDWSVTAHELGHNYGLMHANFWDTITNTCPIATGTNVEYGNIFDNMGSSGGQFSAIFKNTLDWLPDTAVHSVSSNGIYRLYPFDSPTRLPGRFYAAKVRKDFQRDYWLEFRGRSAEDNAPLQYGLLLDWSPWTESGGGSHLLDTTPGSALGRRDAALVIGRTFDDFANGIHITPLQRLDAVDDTCIEVQINLGSFFDNQPPELEIEIDSTNAAPGALVYFHASAFDPDGDTLAYAWSFDDGTFSTNNLPWTYKRWASPGEHLVRCVVSDMKGGASSLNSLITIDRPTGFHILGQVVDTNGYPVEGVRVENGKTTLDEYRGCITDSHGRYLLTDVSGETELFAYKYGFTFTNVTWVNPLLVDSNILQAEFVATPLPTLTITVSTNQASENGLGPNYFQLTRTGDAGTNLLVNLTLSGTASTPSDFRMVPELLAGTNSVEFPPGSNTLVVAVTLLNDAVIEGPETITVTLAEDPAYALSSFSEATLTILDDDAPTKPAVSVAATTSQIPENGTDIGQFVISRNGPTDKELYVYYSVQGTAQMGQDYTTLPRIALIPSGKTTTTVEFLCIDDREVESAESVVIVLDPDPSYSINAPAQAEVRLADDDVTVATVFGSGDAPSENSSNGRFTVKRDGDLTPNLLVQYQVSGSASSASDYEPLSGSVTIPAGAASADVIVAPVRDGLLEGDESVVLTLAAGKGYNVGSPASAVLFIHDEQKPSVNIVATGGPVTEPGEQLGAFEISRGSVTQGALTVYLAISGTATSGSDYVPLDSTVVIPDGKNKVTLDVIAFDDLHYEPTEFIQLSLLPNTNYNVGPSPAAEIQILDEDSYNVPAAGFAFAASSAPEAVGPQIMVSLSYTSASPAVVSYRVIGGTASAADYTLSGTNLTFEPGETAKLLPLTVKNNGVFEPDRTIRLALYDPVGATLDGIKIHTFTILDDDSATVSIAAIAANASESGPLPGTFRISRNGRTNDPLTVTFEVSGTASASADYAPLGTSATLLAGRSYVDLSVLPKDDHTPESPETVTVRLVRAPGASITSGNVATITIADNDANDLPVVFVTATNGAYAVEGGAHGQFTFWRSSNRGRLTVQYTLSGTAVNGTDYGELPTAVVFEDGQPSVSLTVSGIDDSQIEGEETLLLALTLGDSYRVEYPSTAQITVQDNDQRVKVDASDFIATEPGTEDIAGFTFTRFGTTNTALRVFYTLGGTAENGVDYTTLANAFTIPAGSLSAVLPLVPLDDLLVEGLEHVTLTLLPDAAYTLDSPNTATLTLVDDEPMLTITATVPEVIEGSQKPGVFTIHRAGNPNYEFTAHVAFGGTSSYGEDYLPLATEVFFPCGAVAVDLEVFALNELSVEGTETVSADLVPDPAYSLLYPSNAVINIIDAGLNQAPVVQITSPKASAVNLLGTNVNMLLEAAVSDDGDTSNLTISWVKVSGPDSMFFGDTNLLNTTVSFTNAGVYVLRVTADDGQLQGFAEVTAIVGAAQLLNDSTLYWTFDEGVGTQVIDASFAGHDGLLVGGPAWTAEGVLGSALTFSGNDDYVECVATNSLLDGARAFSLSLWLRPDSTISDSSIMCADPSGTNTTLFLSAMAKASCGQHTNVIEATVPTTRGSVRRISSDGILSTNWQHVALVWSNGLAPALFINGQFTQPRVHMAPLSGAIAHCPEFIVGKGPRGGPESWKGGIDEVMLYPRALSRGEVLALAGASDGNYGPVVDAGTNETLQINMPVVLAGSVSDDGRPIPPGLVTTLWTNVSGPSAITIPDPSALTNTVEFNVPGDYVLRLIADDGEVKTYDEITLTLIEPTRVDIYASDPDAAELGPDTGQFTFSRYGDINAELTVFFCFSGITTNGLDYVELPDSITFSNGVETVDMLVTPYLDHRTEGDQNLTLTIATNRAYSIGNGEATVIIHDSPFGAWCVERFSLEELTDPTLSGENADFDHDGLGNFAEYAANLDPKSPETNAPVLVKLEPGNSNGPQVTVTYHRRVQPTDAAYALSVSSDLITWNTGPDFFDESEPVNDENYLTQTVTARLRLPFPATGSLFISLRVWLLATEPPDAPLSANIQPTVQPSARHP